MPIGMKGWLEIVGDLLLIAFGVILLYIFITIGFCGWYGWEDNKIVLYTEIGMSLFIMGLGVNRYLNDLRGNSR